MLTVQEIRILENKAMRQCNLSKVEFCDLDVLNPNGQLFHKPIEKQKEFLIVHDAMHITFGYGLNYCEEYKLDWVHRQSGVIDFDSLDKSALIRNLVINEDCINQRALIKTLIPETSNCCFIHRFEHAWSICRQNP